MNTAFQEIFGRIEDPRIDRTKLHKLLDIIALGILGAMAGSQCFEKIEDFGTLHEGYLKTYLSLENGIPSHDTISRAFQSLNPQTFQEIFLQWLQTVKEFLPKTIVPIDGKTLRGSHERSRGLKRLHVVSAWSCANGLSLGQLQVDGKSNEITAIPELINHLMLKESIVTIDSMGYQREIAKLIREQEADYVFGLKGNQGNLEESVRDCFKLKDELFLLRIAETRLVANMVELKSDSLKF
jgi:predicted transposase YbfD/YdcC